MTFSWNYATRIHQIVQLKFLVSRGTNSRLDFGSIWICTEEFEFLDLVEFGGVAFSVKTVRQEFITWLDNSVFRTIVKGRIVSLYSW